MSFHFTQSCAFIAYLFVFMGLLFVFYWGKSTQFFGSAKDLVRFSSDAGSNSKCKNSGNLDAKLKELVFRGVEV